MRVAILGLLVTGCVTIQSLYTASGKPGYSIECSGTAGSWGECYLKASELCGSSGYEVMDRVGDQAGIIRRTLVIACK
jgi:hypothetical protein